MRPNLLKQYGEALICLTRQLFQKRSFSPLIQYLKSIYDGLAFGNQNFLDFYRQLPEEVRLNRLKNLTRGLHSLLPDSISFSILIAVDQPRIAFFENTLESAFSQSAHRLEILIGISQNATSEIIETISKAKMKWAKGTATLKIIQFEGSVPNAFKVNRLAEEAQGQYLFILGQEDWIRSDLLFRYEQTLRLSESPERLILTCYESRYNSKLGMVFGGTFQKPSDLPFPYVFTNLMGHGLMMSRSFWRKVGGYQKEFLGAEVFDLSIRSTELNAQFEVIPISLYRTPEIIWKTDQNQSFTKSLQSFVSRNHLEWKVEPLAHAPGCRAIPELKVKPKIHIVIPFKDQGDLTLKAARSIYSQIGVEVHLTAVDNGSQDAQIAKDLISLGAEVIRVEEPFNFSRLNNLGVKKSKIDSSYSLLLFLNNDVELNEDALQEMARWIQQTGIGLVGCELLYPDGRLQHGGVDLCQGGPTYRMNWFHTDHQSIESDRRFSKIPRVVDAVTAACAMIRKEVFLEVNGFDEIWFPVAYSDTSLALKVRGKGLKCFYTPFATGIHYESVSRAKGSIEDFEESRWLHEKYLQRVNMKDSQELQIHYETRFF